MRVTLNSTFIMNRRNCCNQMTKKAAKPLSTGISAPRGKYFYLSVNCYFDINSCEAQFTSKWGQTVDARFVQPQNYSRIIKSSKFGIDQIPFRFAFSFFPKYFPNILILFVSRMNSQNTLLVAKKY